MSSDENTLSPYTGLAKIIRPLGSASLDACQARPIDAPVRLGGPSREPTHAEMMVDYACYLTVGPAAPRSPPHRIPLAAAAWLFFAMVFGMVAARLAVASRFESEVLVTTAVICMVFAYFSLMLAVLGFRLHFGSRCPNCGGAARVAGFRLAPLSERCIQCGERLSESSKAA